MDCSRSLSKNKIEGDYNHEKQRKTRNDPVCRSCIYAAAAHRGPRVHRPVYDNLLNSGDRRCGRSHWRGRSCILAEGEEKGDEKARSGRERKKRGRE